MKISAKIKIGDLIEALGCINPMQEIEAPKTLKVKTPDGYKKVVGLRKTNLNKEWKIETKNFSTIVADEHKIETKYGSISDKNKKWEYVKNIKIDDEVYTENGWEKVLSCFASGNESYMYDLQVEETNSYFGDGFHNHNSIFLPNCGLKALYNGFNVVHYSLEMSEDRVGMRYDAAAAGIVIKQLSDSRDEVKDAYRKIQLATKTHLKIKEFPTGMASVLDIESHLEHLRLHSDFEPDIILVDYGDIMRSMHKSANTYEEQGWIFRELRGLAVKKNIAVITATQANRSSLASGASGTKEIIGMGETADSMEKNRILDGLFTITQSAKERDEGKINLYMAKNRNGAANSFITFLINYNTMTIKDPSMGVFNTESDTQEDVT